jgi:hypothetical protein
MIQTFNYRGTVNRIVNGKLFRGTNFIGACGSIDEAYYLLNDKLEDKFSDNISMNILEVDSEPLTESRLESIKNALINNTYYPSNFILKESKDRILPNKTSYLLSDGKTVVMSVDTNKKLNSIINEKNQIPDSLMEFIKIIKQNIGK